MMLNLIDIVIVKIRKSQYKHSDVSQTYRVRMTYMVDLQDVWEISNIKNLKNTK